MPNTWNIGNFKKKKKMFLLLFVMQFRTIITIGSGLVTRLLYLYSSVCYVKHAVYKILDTRLMWSLLFYWFVRWRNCCRKVKELHFYDVSKYTPRTIIVVFYFFIDTVRRNRLKKKNHLIRSQVHFPFPLYSPAGYLIFCHLYNIRWLFFFTHPFRTVVVNHRKNKKPIFYIWIQLLFNISFLDYLKKKIRKKYHGQWRHDSDFFGTSLLAGRTVRRKLLVKTLIKCVIRCIL